MKIFILLPFFIISVHVAESLHLKGKLIDGHRVEDREQPKFQAIAYITYDNSIRCTAAAVSLSHLITVAHCISDLILYNNIDALTGFRAFIKFGNQIKDNYSFKQVEVHPHYNMETGRPEYNIGIITLMSEINRELSFTPLDFDKKAIKFKKGEVLFVPGYHTKRNIRPIIELEYATVNKYSIHSALANQFRKSWGICPHLFVAVQTDSSYMELSDTGSPMLDENKFNIRGILCHVPDNMLLTIFIDTQVFLPWIEAAKRNEQFQSLGRKFLMRPIG